jgi:hypothetical protein
MSPRDGRVRGTERAAALCRDATSEVENYNGVRPLGSGPIKISFLGDSPRRRAAPGALSARCGLSARPSSPRSCACTRTATP